MSAVQSMVVFGHVYFLNFVANNFSTTNQSFIQPTPHSTEIPTITESLTQSMPSTTPEPKLRSDYTYTPGVGAHKLYRVTKPWNEARSHCEKEGAHLAIINSHAEMKAIVKSFETNWTISWIGAHDFYTEGQFVTIHGEPLATAGFAEWDLGEPNNAGDGEDCVLATRLGKLNDVKCTDKVYFTCELPL